MVDHKFQNCSLISFSVVCFFFCLDFGTNGKKENRVRRKCEESLGGSDN